MNPEELDFFRHLKKEQNQNVALNLIKSLEDRSFGHFKKNVKSKEDRELYAEEELIRKEKYEELRCEMPGVPRSTFLMVFSPDGTKVASTHGNHNIYVTDLRNGRNVKTLVGHPRTPWCIAFHPTSNQIVASGCLGGQVRIWDLSGGSEVWTASNQSVIASIAFHPNDRVLVIATINEVYFWDWSKPEPFCHTATGNQKEKVRYVAFDKLGHKLITGISNSQNRWDYVRSSVPVSRQSERSVSPYRRRITHRIFNYFPARHNTLPPAPPSDTPREPLSSVPERERNITVCYRNLVRDYGRLVQRYLQLYRPPAMIDRGTDPMEQNNPSRSSSSSQIPEPSTSSQPDNSGGGDNDNPSTSSRDQPSTSNCNPYQLLTPSRILEVMNRPFALLRGTQASESRKHKVERSCSPQENSSGKKMKINKSSSGEPHPKLDEAKTLPLKTDQCQLEPSQDSPQPGPSTSSASISGGIPDREQALEDIIRGSVMFKVRDDLFEMNTPLGPSTSETNISTSTPNENAVGSTNTLDESREVTSECHSHSNSLNTNPSPGSSNDANKNIGASNSMTTPREASRKVLMDFLKKCPKVKKIPQKCTPRSGSDGSSTSEGSDDEQNIKDNSERKLAPQPISSCTQHRKANLGTETGCENTIEETFNGRESVSQTQDVAGSSNTNTATETPIDYSIPGTSRDDTERESGPREAQRLELMMMNIRRNAEEKLRSRFLPLIRSVPENDRLELIRLFEQGVRESREKARLRYRNMGQMFNKKPNPRLILDTSSDTTSSEDERDPLHMDFCIQPTQNDRVGENSTMTSGSSIPGRSQGGAESSNRDAYHDINNLENWVTSLFDDIEPQGNSTSNTSTNMTATQTTTTTSTSTTIDSLLDRPPRWNRVQSIRRIYAKVLRDRVNTRDSANSTTTTSATSITVSSPSSVSPAGNTSTRTTNSTIYSFARRRLGTHRASAFLPTRVYYHRSPPEFRRNRQSSFGRWRLNQRPYRSHNLGDRPIPSPVVHNNNSFASDEVINFSELPNSEDDPVPSLDRRPSTPSPSFPYNFHPFNPPPDLPSINPENIGIGNMYSNIVQDLETSLNDVRNIRAANRPGEMSDMLSNFSERLENIMNQSETILRNLRTSVEMLPGNETNDLLPGSSAPTASFNDANFYIRDQRSEGNDLERNIESILGGHPSNNVTSDHTYPRNSDSSASPSSSSETMSPLMTSLHLTISHIQRQARLLRQQVESIERIDRAMVEVAQLQLMRLLLVELSRYVRNMSGESRSTCMSSVRQMMAGTRISDSSPGESQSNDSDTTQASSSHSQPNTSTMSSDPNNMPSARTRGLAHKTYPPSRLSRLQRQYHRRSTFINHVPRRYGMRLPPRSAPSVITPVSINLDPQSMLHMYSRVNTFTLNRMSRRLDELINEQVRIFTQRSYVAVPPRSPGGNMGEQNLATRLRDSITRTNRLVGSIFDADVVRNYQMDSTAVSRDGVDRFYARQTLAFIIDGISSHLDETRGSALPHNIMLQIQGAVTMSMLLSELLLLHIVDSIPPPTDMNLDQERQSLTNRIDQMCTTMMMSSRYGGYSANLTHSLRQLQTMIRQNSNQSFAHLSPRRRALDARSRALEARSRALYRSNLTSRMINRVHTLPSRAQERVVVNQAPEVESQPNDDNVGQSRASEAMESRIRTLTRLNSSLHSLYSRMDDQSDQNEESEARSTEENTAQMEENLDLRARALEARTRALHRMQMMDRLRSSMRTLQARSGEQAEQSQAQNSESDDNSRPSGSGQRRDHQMPGPSSDFGSWQDNSLNQSADIQNEESRYGESWTNSESNFPSNRPFRIAPSYRPTPPVANSSAPPTSSNSEEWPNVSRWPWNVPSVQVNDVPVSEFGPSQESSESDNPPSLGNNNNNNNSYPTRGVMARLAAIRGVNLPLGVFRPRFLHPLYASVNPFDADLDDPQREHIYDSDVITTVTPNHRIQVWDISDSIIPVITNPLKNVVVSECKIHNDASVDIASDGSILVTLLPSGGYLNVTNRLGVYSLKWETLGQCLYTTNFDHNAVSVSLSPLGRHLVVGLASRRVSIVPSERWMMARIFRIEQKDIPGDRLPIVKELDQSRDGRAISHKSVNCIRWLPTSGQGLIYATNTGQLVIWT